MRSRESSSVATAAGSGGGGSEAGGADTRTAPRDGGPTVCEAVDAEADLVWRLGLELALEQLRAEHKHVRLGVERLGRRQEADALESEALLAHDLDDVERRPAHVMAEHVELRERGVARVASNWADGPHPLLGRLT